MRLPLVAVSAVILASCLSDCQLTAPTGTPACEVVRGRFIAADANNAPVTGAQLHATSQLVDARIQRAGYVGGTASAVEPDTIVIELAAPAAPEWFRHLAKHGTELEFIPIAVGTFVEPGAEIPRALPALFANGAVTSATPVRDAADDPAVELQLTEEGKAVLANWTQVHVGQQLAITLDRVVVVAPSVRTPLLDGRFVLSGNLFEEDVSRIQMAVSEGVLPLDLAEVSLEQVAVPCP